MDQVNKLVGIVIAVVVGSILIGSTAPMMVDRLTTSQATDDIDGLNEIYNEHDLTNSPEEINEELADEFNINTEYLGYIDQYEEVEENEIVTFDEIGVEAEINELTNVNDGDVYVDITLSSVETGEEIDTVEFEFDPDNLDENAVTEYNHNSETYQIYTTGIYRDGDGNPQAIPIQNKHDDSAASIKDVSHGYIYSSNKVWYLDTNIKYYDNNKNLIIDDNIGQFELTEFQYMGYDGHVANLNDDVQQNNNELTAEYTILVEYYDQDDPSNMGLILIGIFLTFILIFYRLATNQEY